MVVRSSDATVGTNENWTFRGHTLEVVHEYKYLGVWFTDKEAWRIIKSLYASLERALLVDSETSRFSKIIHGVR